MLTRKRYKPKIKKLQAILVLNPPNNVKKLRRFLGIITLTCEQSSVKCWPLSQEERVWRKEDNQLGFNLPNSI
jgi:hypothetical protein